jgi:hypothetical protein
MMTAGSRRGRGPLVALLAFIVCTGLVSCKKAPAHQERVPEPYTATSNAIKFDILPVGTSAFTHAWSASYTDGQRTTHFRLELSSETGKGQFTSQPDSDPTLLLESLQPALKAKHVPRNVVHVDVLPFTLVLLGENQKRQPDGSFSNAKGNWMSMRIMLGKGEVYLNLNPVDAIAEFAMKDPAYGDAVLAELAKVF